MTPSAPSRDAGTPPATGPQPRTWSLRVNPVWQRELLAASRLTRTPYVLMTTTIVLTVVTCTVGGIASASLEPSELGSVLYQVFFSLCFAVVAWVGPFVGTQVITSEYAGRTWDALRLCSLTPAELARGKFLAAGSYLGTYLLMLAPIGAVPFLSGGVTAAEVVLAFVVLAAFAVLTVGFGVAIGSSLRRPAPAMLLSVLLAAAASIAWYFGLGIGGSVLANHVWPRVSAGAPVWLPLAWCRAPIDFAYLSTLVFAPLTLASCCGWLCYELTVANFSDPNDDRLAGIKRWALGSFVPLSLVLLVPLVWASTNQESWLCYAGAMLGAGLLVSVLMLILLGDGFTPSRKVQLRLATKTTSAFERWLAPHLPRSLALALLLGGAALLAYFAAGGAEELAAAKSLGVSATGRIAALGCVASTIMACLVLQFGLSIRLRARDVPPSRSRVILLVTMFVLGAGPWIALGIAGLIQGQLTPHSWLAAPSPFFVLVLVAELQAGSDGYTLTLLAWALSLAGYLFSGVLLWITGSRQARLAAKAMPR